MIIITMIWNETERHESIYSNPSMGKIGQNVFFSVGKVTSQGEGKI